MHPTVANLLTLTEQYVNGQLPASEFDRTYRQTFAGLPSSVDDKTFKILEELALDCNDYVNDPTLRDEPGDLDDGQLMASAKRTLSRFS